MTDDVPGHDAHQIALELLKQIITLASGVLALSATFIGEFRTADRTVLLLLVLAWLLLAGAVLCGLQAISSIVKSRLSGDKDWATGVGREYASWSKRLFVLGLLAFAIFAMATLVTSGQAVNAMPVPGPAG